MSSRIPATTALLLLATGVVHPLAHADQLDDEVPPGLVGFEDSSRSPEPLFDSPAPAIPSPRAPAPAGPRFEITAGPYTSTRALRFTVSDGLADDELPMVSPQSTLVGMSLAASVFPVARDARGRLVGPGLSASYGHSVGAGADFLDHDDNDESMLTLPVVQAAYAIGLRYRQPLGPALVELGASHRTQIQRIDERPEWVEIPDVEYRSIAAEARLEIIATGGATIALAGRYHYVLDAGEITSLDGYGSSSVSAYDLEAGLDVPLTGGLFVTGGLTYRHVAMTFAGDGDLATLDGSDLPDVFGAQDRYVDARLAVGARY